MSKVVSHICRSSYQLVAKPIKEAKGAMLGINGANNIFYHPFSDALTFILSHIIILLLFA